MVSLFRAHLFLTALLVLAAGNLCSADEGCVGWDALIEDILLQPLRDELIQAKVDFYKLPAFDLTFGWGVALKSGGGSVGNLTSFDIVHLPGAKGNASYMCQYGDNMTLAIDLSIKDTELNMDNFIFTLPILPSVGNTKTVIRNSGNAVSVSVSLDTSGSTCVASVNYIELRELGNMSVKFGNGFFNAIYEFIFNHFYSLIAKIMLHFGVLDHMSKFIQQEASSLIAQQGSKICDLINGGGL